MKFKKILAVSSAVSMFALSGCGTGAYVGNGRLANNVSRTAPGTTARTAPLAPRPAATPGQPAAARPGAGSTGYGYGYGTRGTAPGGYNARGTINPGGTGTGGAVRKGGPSAGYNDAMGYAGLTRGTYNPRHTRALNRSAASAPAANPTEHKSGVTKAPLTKTTETKAPATKAVTPKTTTPAVKHTETKAPAVKAPATKAVTPKATTPAVKAPAVKAPATKAVTPKTTTTTAPANRSAAGIAAARNFNNAGLRNANQAAGIRSISEVNGINPSTRNIKGNGIISGLSYRDEMNRGNENVRYHLYPDGTTAPLNANRNHNNNRNLNRSANNTGLTNNVVNRSSRANRADNNIYGNFVGYPDNAVESGRSHLNRRNANRIGYDEFYGLNGFEGHGLTRGTNAGFGGIEGRRANYRGINGGLGLNRPNGVIRLGNNAGFANRHRVNMNNTF